MRTLSLITIFLVASLSFAQDCNNPLLDFYGLTGLSDPQSGSDLPYCSNLQNADTCCSADTVAGFQDKANGIIDKLNNYFAAKDLYLSQLRNSYFDRFNDMLEDINDDHSDDLREIRNGDATIADLLQTDIDESNRLRTEARDINRDFVRALDEYQRARNDCFDTALQVQASAWCLACDPNYATEGVNDDGSVAFSDGLCQAVSDACWPFFNQSARFNPLVNARAAYWRLSAVSRYLNDYSDNEQIVPFNVSEDPYSPLASQQAVEVPDEWIGSPEEAGNSGQCSDLWAGDDLLAELLTIGAPGSAADDNENNQDNGDDTVVVVDPNPNARLLQDALAEDEGIWAPELDGTGLDFGSLRNDPGTFFGASDYSDYFNQTQNNGNDNTDRTDNDDHTDNDIWDRTDSN